VAGSERELPLAPVPRAPEGTPLLAPPTEGQNIAADYRSRGSRWAPPAGVAARGTGRGSQSSRRPGWRDLPNGRVVRVAGIVTARQRPQSAGGVMFVTLEDETGHVNLIVWEARLVARTAHRQQLALLEVQGQLQKEGGVTHVVANRLVDRSHLLGSVVTRSRDFR
jgi:error-prone DNA polymerase